ncbi:MAG TPA: hypothetical protein PKO06_02170 [Candidatus Ozemobacteraceae bacterium]|nr:hypothetical protein [Candidatus Ozemobacteraceae bacterium]
MKVSNPLIILIALVSCLLLVFGPTYLDHLKSAQEARQQEELEKLREQRSGSSSHRPDDFADTELVAEDDPLIAAEEGLIPEDEEVLTGDGAETATQPRTPQASSSSRPASDIPAASFSRSFSESATKSPH